MRTVVFTLALLVATQASAAAPQPIVWNCESADAFQKLSQVPALRTAHKLGEASALIASLAPADRANRHAQFDSALIVLDANGKNPAVWSSALTNLAHLADAMPNYSQLSPAQRACQETPRLYAIFNTLGVQYSQSGNRAAAIRYFLRGEANEAALAPDSRAKLNYNLGVYYTGQLNLDKASYYYQRAKSPAAIVQFQAIQKAQTLAPVQATAPAH